MADTAWKRFEREICRDFGGERTGPMGRDLPDCAGARLAFECKAEKASSLLESQIVQAEENAAKVGLPWCLVYKKLRNRKLVVMEYSTLLELYRLAYPA